MILADFGARLGRIINSDGADLDRRVLRAHIVVELESAGKQFHVWDFMATQKQEVRHEA